MPIELKNVTRVYKSNVEVARLTTCLSRSLQASGWQ